jgi:hypothetical protein
MSSIFKYINKNDIDIQHDYFNNNPSIKLFSNIFFRTSTSSFQDFQLPLALKEESNKFISISNKQLSYLPFHLKHFQGHQYATDLKEQSFLLKKRESPILIEEPVFLFFDAEATNGSSHTYDLLFYYLFHYINSNINIKAKLLCVNLKKENIWYKKLLSLIQSYYQVEYLFIDTDTNYYFKSFYAIQSYGNIFFPYVKEFINKTLITPIIHKYSSMNMAFSETIYKFKVKNSSNLYCYHDFIITPSVKEYLDSKNAINLDDYSEEEKIYLLSKAKTIYCSWGSSWYINICYYISDYSDKFFNCIFHENIAIGEYDFISEDEEKYILRGNMPFWATKYPFDQIYTSLTLNGKKYRMENLESILNF